MKLSEKIILLRKEKGITQEELAAVCNVSRQSISKWEADIALPEIDKILTMGKYFNVTLDVLLKDELSITGIKEVHSCGINAIQEKKNEIYVGMLIKESINDEDVLDYITVNKIELWNTGGRPKYWTVLYFTANNINFPEIISKAIISDETRGGNWFVDFKSGNKKYIVFKDKVLMYHIGNESEKEEVCKECKKLGIEKNQMNWSE